MTWRPGHACIEQEVRTLRHGETVDLTALYETYSDLLFRTALTYVSHSEDAQDVVHDVFAVYLAKRPTFQDTSHQRAWMLRVTINKCRDLQRRNAVRRYTPLEDAEHIASPEDSETSELLAAVRSLPEAVDDYTLKISFKNVTPVEDWLILHNKYFYVLPEHLLGDIAPEKMKDDEFWKAPIGSGPCTFISELSGSQLELGSFADYQLGAPQFGKLILKVIASTNTITSIAAGEMDGFYQQPTTDDALAAKDMGLTVTESSEPTFVGVFLINNQNVSDKRIRQAMSYAIDKDLLIEQNLQGKGIVPATCVIPGSEYDCGLTWSRDVDKAKELLAEAGWDSSRTLKMAVTSARESMAAIIQQNLAEAGITIDVQTVELATMFSGLQDGTYDLGICGSTAMSSTALWMSGYYDNKNATYCQITDTAYAELQDKIAAETDEAKKKELVNEYQQLLWDEMPLVMLYNGYTFGVQSERFQGYNAFEGGVNNQAVWKWSVKE